MSIVICTNYNIIVGCHNSYLVLFRENRFNLLHTNSILTYIFLRRYLYCREIRFTTGKSSIYIDWARDQATEREDAMPLLEEQECIKVRESFSQLEVEFDLTFGLGRLARECYNQENRLCMKEQYTIQKGLVIDGSTITGQYWVVNGKEGPLIITVKNIKICETGQMEKKNQYKYAIGIVTDTIKPVYEDNAAKFCSNDTMRLGGTWIIPADKGSGSLDQNSGADRQLVLKLKERMTEKEWRSNDEKTKDNGDLYITWTVYRKRVPDPIYTVITTPALEPEVEPKIRRMRGGPSFKPAAVGHGERATTTGSKSDFVHDPYTQYKIIPIKYKVDTRAHLYDGEFARHSKSLKKNDSSLQSVPVCDDYMENY